MCLLQEGILVWYWIKYWNIKYCLYSMENERYTFLYRVLWRITVLVMWYVGDVICWWCDMLVMWYVGYVICWWCDMLVMWYVGDVICWWCDMTLNFIFFKWLHHYVHTVRTTLRVYVLPYFIVSSWWHMHTNPYIC